MKIVFWNVYKKDLTNELAILAQEIDPDILFLAECTMNVADVLNSLNRLRTSYFFNYDPICLKIHMFSKFRDKFVKPITGSLRYTVRNVKIPLYPSFNLMCLHFQSKQNWDAPSQAAHSATMSTVIKEFEGKTKSSNSIIIGDFNMNPFEPGMIQTTGFHSTMSKSIAQRKSRIVDGHEYPFFYNPMWSFFGDEGKGDVNGTFYSSRSQPINYFWSIFDQVLIRPDLIPYLEDDGVKIITEFGVAKKLLKPNETIDDAISDHLPISCTLKRI
ncbi:endonuclease/exonuclease/phosphatase family protein [Dyadobacter beijingensis]|nr:endonuclease/exonuclease/phosphatase family protein [Dyadobacter beijingensis]